ncbi:MAG TPA: ParB/RepB/Spo0J family partition protein [Nitrososphaerales archaeon]|nr:ParB/RepB/Spo0J family partition protein [Nitrososphaerales archaeon]
MIPIAKLKESRYQTRDAAFSDKDDLENLASSIRSAGLLQLPIVRRDADDLECFEIISGHRRVHAVSKFLGWEEVKCAVYEGLDELEAFRLGLTENIQRANLSPYEEGVAYLLCKNLFGFSDEELAHQLNKSRQTITSKRELAVAANKYLNYLDGSTSNRFLRNFAVGHQEILRKLKDPQKIAYALKMVSRGASVRNIQRFVELFATEEESNDRPAEQYDRPIAKMHTETYAAKILLKKLHRLKEEIPKRLEPTLIELEEMIGTFVSDYEIFHETIESALTTTSSDDRRFKPFICPNCREELNAVRSFDQEHNLVLFILAGKDEQFETAKTILAFRGRIETRRDR